MFKVNDKVYVRGDKSRIEYTIYDIDYCSCKAILKPYFNAYNMEDLEPVTTYTSNSNSAFCISPALSPISNSNEDLIACVKKHTKELGILRRRFYKNKWKSRAKYGRR